MVARKDLIARLVESDFIFCFQTCSTDKPTDESGQDLEVFLKHIEVVAQLAGHVEGLGSLLDEAKLRHSEDDFGFDDLLECLLQLLKAPVSAHLV